MPLRASVFAASVPPFCKSHSAPSATVIMKTAILSVLLLGIVACASAQYPACPNATVVKGVNVVGDWKGYFLSTTDSKTYYQAAAYVTFSQSASGAIAARVNISQPVCTGGCPCTFVCLLCSGLCAFTDAFVPPRSQGAPRCRAMRGRLRDHVPGCV